MHPLRDNHPLREYLGKTVAIKSRNPESSIKDGIYRVRSTSFRTYHNDTKQLTPIFDLDGVIESGELRDLADDKFEREWESTKTWLMPLLKEIEEQSC